MFTCLEPPVHPRRAVGHDGLDMQELIDAVVTADDRKAEAFRRLDQLTPNSLAPEQVRVSREEGGSWNKDESFGLKKFQRSILSHQEHRVNGHR